MYNSLEQLQNVVPNNVKMNLHGKKREPLLSNSLGPARRRARDLPRLRRVPPAHLKLSKELAHESSPPSVYPAVVSGIASQERFPIEEEGFFMRRLFYCCAGLALCVSAFADVARAQFKSGGQAIELRLPTISQRAIERALRERAHVAKRREVAREVSGDAFGLVHSFDFPPIG